MLTCICTYRRIVVKIKSKSDRNSSVQVNSFYYNACWVYTFLASPPTNLTTHHERKEKDVNCEWGGLVLFSTLVSPEVQNISMCKYRLSTLIQQQWSIVNYKLHKP